jgi:protocatechuate 3,4-dioxygenase beta subunit
VSLAIRLLFALLILLPLHAQPLSVEGTVIDRTTRLPVPDARVRVSGSYGDRKAHEQYTQTDTQGHFTAKVPAPATYSFSATAAGYSVEAIHRQVSIDIKSETQPAPITLLLTRTATLEGAILDADSVSPIPHLSVTALRLTWQRGRRQTWFEGTPASTDTKGKFKFSNLPPGDYIFEIDSSPARPQAGKSPSTTHADSRYARLIWPGDSIQSAAPILLSPGANTNIGDIKIAKGQAATLTIAVGGGSCASGQAVALELNQTMGASRFSRGVFTIPCGKSLDVPAVPPGQYELQARASWQDPSESEYAAAAIEMLRVDQSVDLILRPAFTITGAIALADVPPGDTREQKLPPSKVRLFPRGLLSNTYMSTVPGRPPVDTLPDGSFSATLYYPPGGLVEVSLPGLPTGWYLKGLEYNHTAITGNRLHFNPDATTQHVRIFISNTPATMQGTVVDAQGKPISDAPVLAVRWPCETSSTYPIDLIETKSTADGSFTIRHLPAANYRIFAISPTARPNLEQPGILYSILQSLDDIPLKEGAATATRLTILKH